MRILDCKVCNFGSYKHLTFQFAGKGLTLIQGDTGSGKSTLCDIIPWILFGKTAKGGTADEVLTWGEEDITTGHINVDVGTYTLSITRKRSSKSKHSDLFFESSNKPGEIQRGKDATDTQRLIIEQLKDLTYDLYVSGAYFHEFSPSVQFFTANAKTRREICEQIMDLDLAKTLQAKSAEKYSDAEDEFEQTNKDIENHKQAIKAETDYYKKLRTKYYEWEANQRAKKEDLSLKSSNFDYDKNIRLTALKKQQKERQESIVHMSNLVGVMQEEYDLGSSIALKDMDAIDLKLADLETCDKCGSILLHTEEAESLKVKRKQALSHSEAASKNLTKIKVLEQKIKSEVNLLTLDEKDIANEVVVTNHYADFLRSIDTETNPHATMLRTADQDMFSLSETLSALSDLKEEQQQYLSDLFVLKSALANFRSIVAVNTVAYLETTTNKMLHDHFDNEIKVELSAAQSDKINIIITKDGNVCTYTQLSKGQRQLLKLCFGVAVMKCVSNRHSSKFEQVFFDEALDGMSDELKVKSYGLLQTLETQYDSIFVVDHSADFKNLFSNQYRVVLGNSGSIIEES